jgi:E3 ubiquitin-protein ligase SH3RF
LKIDLCCVPSCCLPVTAHNQERPTAAVTPIQVQNAACLGPASVGLPHHLLASPQPLPAMAGPAAHVAAVSISRANAPLACAAAASFTSPSITTASLETEPSGRTVNILPGLPTSPDSAASACGNSSATKPDKDSKVRPISCFSAHALSHSFQLMKGLTVP